jgi:hypothetical protein
MLGKGNVKECAVGRLAQAAHANSRIPDVTGDFHDFYEVWRVKQLIHPPAIARLP